MFVLPPSFHEQRSVGDAKAHVPRPFGGDTPSCIQIGKYGNHLYRKMNATPQITKFKYFHFKGPK